MSGDLRFSCVRLTLAAVALCGAAAHAQDKDMAAPVRRTSVKIVGGRLPWSMTMPPPWVGGNYDQLEALVRSAQLGAGAGQVRKLRDALREGKSDAAAAHLDDAIDHEHGILPYSTVISVMVLAADTGPAFREDEGAAWNKLAGELLIPTVSPEAKIRFVVPDKAVSIGQLRAYETVFLIEGMPQGDFCTGMAVIPLGKRGTHLFTLHAPRDRCEVRYEEFKAMLRGLRYDPTFLHEIRGAGR